MIQPFQIQIKSEKKKQSDQLNKQSEADSRAKYTTSHDGNIELTTDTENEESEITSTGGGVIIVIGRRRI